MLALQYFAQYTDQLDPGFSSDPTFTSTNTSTGPFPWAFLITLWVITILLAIFMGVVMWKIYTKAGRPGWAAIVPVYNVWVLFEMVGFPGWVSVLSLVPFVNFAVAIMEIVALYKLVKLFGKGDGFAIATIFFSYITLPILAFGKAQFQGTPQAAQPYAGGYPSQAGAYPAYGQPMPGQAPQNPYPQQPAGPQPPEQQPPQPPAQPQQ